MVKKFLLSGLVIIVFAFYALYERGEQSGTKATTIPASSTSTNTNNTKQTGKYKNGTYVGDSIAFIYGNMQVKTTITNGSISDVQFLQYPNDRDTSVQINTQAMPILKSEAIQAQSSQVDVVTGATDSSEAFQKSLETGLVQAQ